MKNEHYRVKFVFALIIACTLIISLVSCNYHTHTFSDEWCHDSTNHWHNTTCEHKDLKDNLEAHTFSEWSIKSCPISTDKGYEGI